MTTIFQTGLSIPFSKLRLFKDISESHFSILLTTLKDLPHLLYTCSYLLSHRV